MYSTYYIFNTGIFLISANYFIGFLWLSCLTILVLYRFRKEENMLATKFGDEYNSYHKITPAFVPYLRTNGKEPKELEESEILY
jgi:protein-S-isoprenylcysteine O-methyltransferase Ste14